MFSPRHASGRTSLVVTGAGLAFALGTVAACGGDDGAAADPAPPEPAAPSDSLEPGDTWEQVGGPVVIIQLPFLSDAANAIARAEGWFDEFGVEIEVEPARSAAALLPTVATGDVDVVFAGISPALYVMMDAGEDVKAVAGGSVLDPDGCTHLGTVALPATRDELDFDDPDALKGLRVGLMMASMAPNYYVYSMIEGWGITIDDIDAIEVDREAQPAVLGRGDVDVMVTQEPWATIMKSELGAVEVSAAQDVLPNQLNSSLVFGGRLLDDRELGTRVLAAYLLREAQYGEGPTDRNVEIMAEITGLEPDLLRAMCWSTLSSDGRAVEDELQELLAFGVEQGELDNVPTSEQIWDHELRALALEFLDDRGLLHLVEG